MDDTTKNLLKVMIAEQQEKIEEAEVAIVGRQMEIEAAKAKLACQKVLIAAARDALSKLEKGENET